MKPRLYLETTIPSYLVARRSRDLRLAADQETTQEWWDTQRQKYELFASQFVRAEAEHGDPKAAAERLALLEGMAILPELESADQLAAEIIAAGLIPPQAAVDASHIAIATAHGMDYLLTWNCRHIHNAFIEHRLQGVCEALGLSLPTLCTPPELMADYLES
jgi:predicted nucleic acid-binding protein